LPIFDILVLLSRSETFETGCCSSLFASFSLSFFFGPRHLTFDSFSILEFPFSLVLSIVSLSLTLPLSCSSSSFVLDFILLPGDKQSNGVELCDDVESALKK
uniref:Secreted protein n=1 Tax=Brugia timori TaxID=42155 RepID=A0A0R3QDV1_9BILA